MVKGKDYLIGILIVAVLSVIFTMPSGSLGILIPSILFSGMGGGLYIGYKRKRPLISCTYDGFILGLFAGIVQAFIILPILWFWHQQRYDIGTPGRFILIMSLACVMLNCLVGGPFGGLTMGIFYRYLVKDRGEGELYESYMDKKTEDKQIKDLMD